MTVQKTTLPGALRHAIATMVNDDLSEPGTKKRARFVERLAAMEAAAVALDTLAAERPVIIGRVTGQEYEGDQCPGMPRAICHACGLGWKCWNPDCEQTGVAPSAINGPQP